VGADPAVEEPRAKENEQGSDEPDGDIEEEHTGVFGGGLPEVLGVVLPTSEACAEGGADPGGVEQERGAAEKDSGVSGSGASTVSDEGRDDEDGEEEDGVVMRGDGEGEASEEGEIRTALPGQGGGGCAAEQEGVATAFGGVESWADGDDGGAEEGA